MGAFVCLYVRLQNHLIPPTFTLELYSFTQLREYCGPNTVSFQIPFCCLQFTLDKLMKLRIVVRTAKSAFYNFQIPKDWGFILLILFVSINVVNSVM